MKKNRAFDRAVNYVNLLELDRIDDMFWEQVTTFLDESHIGHLFTKPDDFEHEQEYRFLVVNSELNTSDENIYLPIKNSFCGLVTGRRFDTKNKENMKRLCDAMFFFIKMFAYLK